jgi:hypothetical protein
VAFGEHCTAESLRISETIDMSKYRAFCDDFYINVNLQTEMEIGQSRDTVMHYFELLRKTYPAMRHFYARERGEFVLEEDKEKGTYRWASIEARRVSSGYVNPPTVEGALEQHGKVLDTVPFALSLSPLDCESLNFLVGFDFTYRGDHNELLAGALGIAPAFEKLLEVPGGSLLHYEPAIQLALDSQCRTQCRLSIESRTSAFHVRTGEFPEDQLSVYLAVRRFGSLEPGETFVSTLHGLQTKAFSLLDDYVIESVLLPLQQAISIQ